jgi:hypothetical protein
MSNDRINELPIVAKLTREYTRIPGTGQRLVNPDGPEAAALLKELVEAGEEIRNLVDRSSCPASYDRLDAALSKARAQ